MRRLARTCMVQTLQQSWSHRPAPFSYGQPRPPGNIIACHCAVPNAGMLPIAFSLFNGGGRRASGDVRVRDCIRLSQLSQESEGTLATAPAPVGAGTADSSLA